MITVYKIQGWVIRHSRKNGITYFLNESKFFYDFDSAMDTFNTLRNQVELTVQSGKNRKGFCTLVKCTGEKGHIFSGEEIIRHEY